MRRTICCAIFGLLVSSDAVFPQAHAAPRLFARPRVRVVGVRWFAAPPVVFLPYCVPDPYPYPVPVPYPVPYPVWNFIPSLPTFGFVGSASETHPQLVFKDGTAYTVVDYWRVDDQLHFVTVEDGGTKSVPHTVPFGELDVQRTTDTNTVQGFRFVLRDEPVEQWLEHHSQRAPARRPRNHGEG
jgi:hypothetical protein